MLVVGRGCGEAVNEHQIVVPVDDAVVAVSAGQLGPASDKLFEVGQLRNEHLLSRGAHGVLRVVDLGSNGNGDVVVFGAALQVVGVVHLLAVDVHVYIAFAGTGNLDSQVIYLAADSGRGRGLEQ